MPGYWSIDLEILHTTATDQLPAFARRLREVLDIMTAETEDIPSAQASDPSRGDAATSDD